MTRWRSKRRSNSNDLTVATVKMGRAATAPISPGVQAIRICFDAGMPFRAPLDDSLPACAGIDNMGPTRVRGGAEKGFMFNENVPLQ
jgi:hypothetical protein